MARVPVMSLALLGLLYSPALAAAQSSVFLEDLTWTEVRDAVRGGKTAVIVPTGGTEQNGPHMVLGKHNYIVKHAAAEIATRLGNALVAPVLGYVPEGGLNPLSGHMWAPGTITLPNEYFEKVVEFAARSFQPHGFLDIILIGDSGGNQQGLAAVSERLNREWAGSPVRVHHVSHYYGNENGVIEWLRSQGESQEDIGIHAGINDTSQLLALLPSGIRQDKLAFGRAGDGSGVNGNATRARAEYGRRILELRIEAAISQFRQLRESSRGR